MASQSAYLSQNNLHFRPFHMRTFRAFTWTAIELEKCSEGERRGTLCGRTARVLSKTILVTGSLAHIQLASIEFLAFGTIGLFGLVVARLTKCNSEIWHKYTLRCWSHCMHSFLSIFVYLALILRRPDLKLHLVNILADHGIYLLSATLIQLSMGTYLDRLVGRHPPRSEQISQAAAMRALFLLRDDAGTFFSDLLSALSRDFGFVNLMGRFGVDEFFRRHPEHRDIFQNFSLAELRRPQMQAQLRNLLQTALRETGLFQPPRPGEENLYIFNRPQSVEVIYQTHLHQMIKGAFRAIYDTPEFARCVSGKENEVNEGREALTSFYPETTIPIANFAQYQELLQDLRCPAAFESSHLRSYNNRLQQLTHARTALQNLSLPERNFLIQKLLRGDDFDLRDQGLTDERRAAIQNLFLEISALAGSLHQGRLMSQVTFNAAAFNARPVVESLDAMVEYQNLFQKACQEAANEIEAAAGVAG